MSNKLFRFSLLATAIILITTSSCKHEPIPPNIPDSSVNPNGTDGICFGEDILPLIQSYCSYSGCHDGSGEAPPLLSYNNIMQHVVAGNADASHLYQAIIGGGEDPMPPQGHPQLTTNQVIFIHNWIQQGAVNSTNCACDSSVYTFSGAVWPTIQGHCVGCHSGNNPSGNPPLDLTGYTNIVNGQNTYNLYGRITGTTGAVMPPMSPMTDCRIAQIKKWIDNGMQNN